MKTSTKLSLAVFVLAVVMIIVVALTPRAARAAGPWYVAPGSSDGNDCLSAVSPCATINGALGKAATGDTIKVAVGTYVSTGTEVVLIDKDITLSGGWNTAFTTQNGMSALDGQLTRRGVKVNSGVTTMIERFVIQNGSAAGPDYYSFYGGGIYNNGGILTLSNSTVSGNMAMWSGAGIYTYGPGSTTTLNNSTISGNTSQTGDGGGIANGGTMILNNSTVSGNTGQYYGGGIYNVDTLTLNNSTVSSNTGGGISTGGNVTTTLRNSILAGNTQSDCLGTIVSAGYNLIGNTSGCTFTPDMGDLTNVTAKLGQLIGSPGYYPLRLSSPAINAGNPAGCMGSTGLLTTDQRGAARVGRCDMGAYEYTLPGPATSIAAIGGTPQHALPLSAFKIPLQTLVLDSIGSPVSNTVMTFSAPGSGASGTFADSGTYTTTAVSNESGVVTAAIFTANSVRGTYPVTATVNGVITPASFLLGNIAWYVASSGNDSNDCQTPATVCATINGALAKSDFVVGNTVFVASGTYTSSTGSEVVSVTKSINLSGGWNSAFTTQNGMSTIDGQSTRRGITIISGVTAIADRFTIQNGSSAQGGGLYNDGTLLLSNSTVTGNTATYYGGGLYNYNGNVTLNNTTISNNTAPSGGGGIFNYYGAMTLNHSLITSNAGGDGGGINVGNGTVTLNNSTVSDNDGGGVWSYGTLTLNNSTISGNKGRGIFHTNGGSLNINNSTISHNTSNVNGGGLYFGYGTATVQNSIIAENNKNNITSGGPDCHGDNSITSAGYNLIGDTSGCQFSSSTGDILNVQAHLGQPVGSPAYYPLLSDSPAINAGNPAGCKDRLGNPLVTDQRGVARVGRCDMGAYEYTIPGPGTRLIVIAGTPQRAAPYSAFETPFRVSVLDSIGSPVGNATVRFSAPLTGASITFADSGTPTTTAVTDEESFAVATAFTANGLTGNYTVTATTGGVITPANFLLSNVVPWYVAPGGDNSNGCQTPATACATVNGILSKTGVITGDIVLMATGIYTGTGNQVILLNKSIRLLGGWNADFIVQTGSSILEGQNARRGLTVNSGVIATLDHFVIQNGLALNIPAFDVGGGVYTEGALALRNSAITSNTAATGGGIYNTGSLTLTHSIVNSNTTGIGGGIYNTSNNGIGNVTLDNSVISGNVAHNGFSGNGFGGGISTSGGTVTLNNSTISDNRADAGGGGGGGIFSGGSTLILNNSTVSGNTTTNTAQPGTVSSGGGIYASGGSVSVNGGTIVGNTANNGVGLGGLGGGIYNYSSSSVIRLQNTIIADNNASVGGTDCSGGIGSVGYNLIGTTSGCDFTQAAGDLTNVAARLGSLQGSPGYHLPLVNSPAINSGNPVGCTNNRGDLLPADQRGAPRVARCDIGAVEVQELEESDKAVNVSIAPPGKLLTYTITLRNINDSVVNNVVLTDSIPSALTYQSGSLSAPTGNYGYANGVITWTGSTNANESITLTFRVTVGQTIDAIVNSAAISGGGDLITRTTTFIADGPVCNLTKYGSNPVLTVAANGTWDDAAIFRPTVLKQGGTYQMWYSASDGTTRRIGYTTSLDGITWTKYGNNPVLAPSAGTWDAVGVSAPSVIYDDGVYKMWYQGIYTDGSARIGYATSPDGIHWTKVDNNLVLEVGPASWDSVSVSEPSVLKVDDTYHLWYVGNDGVTLRIGHATSTDGRNWLKDAANPVLGLGSPGSWDWLNVYSPSVVKVGDAYKLWYSGSTLPAASQIGYATSLDGSHWTREQKLIAQGTSNAFDGYSADYPSVIVDGQGYKVWYSGLNSSGTYNIGYATAEVCSAAPPSTLSSHVYLPIVIKNASCQAYYSDSFGDSKSGWPTSDDSNRRYAYTNGEYQILVKNQNEGWLVTPGAKATDFTAAVSARRASGTSGAYGIVFGINGYWNEFYEVLIDANSYSIWRYNYGWTALKSWTTSLYIATGTNWNRLKVVRSGTSISFYVNNQLLTTLNDGSFTGLRRIGLAAESDNVAFDARFDDFSLYPASCGAGVYRATSDAGQFEMGQSEIHAAPLLPGK